MSAEKELELGLVPAKLEDSSSLEVLEYVENIVPLLDPVIGKVASICIAAVRENRIEVEVRLAARLQELATIFSSLEVAQALEVQERDKQYRVLCIFLDLAQSSGDPELVREAMAYFREYVRKTPTFTRNVVDLATALQPADRAEPSGEGQT